MENLRQEKAPTSYALVSPPRKLVVTYMLCGQYIPVYTDTRYF